MKADMLEAIRMVVRMLNICAHINATRAPRYATHEWVRLCKKCSLALYRPTHK